MSEWNDGRYIYCHFGRKNNRTTTIKDIEKMIQEDDPLFKYVKLDNQLFQMHINQAGLQNIALNDPKTKLKNCSERIMENIIIIKEDKNGTSK
jgi:hypothetical protein